MSVAKASTDKETFDPTTVPNKLPDDTIAVGDQGYYHVREDCGNAFLVKIPKSDLLLPKHQKKPKCPKCDVDQTTWILKKKRVWYVQKSKRKRDQERGIEPPPKRIKKTEEEKRLTRNAKQRRLNARVRADPEKRAKKNKYNREQYQRTKNNPATREKRLISSRKSEAKESRIIGKKIWEMNNKLKRRAIDRKYKDGHRAILLERSREYESRPEVKLRRKQYRRLNREKSRVYQKSYRMKNLIRARNYTTRYMTKHPDRYFFSQLKSTCKRKNILCDLELVDYRKLMLSDCFYCGEKSPNGRCGLDKVNPKGHYLKSNVVPCCKICNRMKHVAVPKDALQFVCNISQKHGLKLNLPVDFSVVGSYLYSGSDGFSRYKNRARRNNMEFELEESEFNNLVLSKCFYCGRQGHKTDPIGVDRINSSIGYKKDNCVACCCYCNYAKGPLPQKLFLEKCELVAARWNQLLGKL
jgi:hypothetical protein